MNEQAWDYISHCFDIEGYIPSWHEIAENVDDDIEIIHETVQRFVRIHDLSEVDNQYKGECA